MKTREEVSDLNNRLKKDFLLSVIIPSFNNLSSLKLVLKSLQLQTLDPSCFEVIVVDDGSSDGTQDWLSEFSPSDSFKVIQHTQNLGRSKARNSGITEAQSPIILFIDGDIICAPSMVENHLHFHQSHHDQPVVALGKVLYHKDVTPSSITRWFDSNTGCNRKGDVPITRFMTQNISVQRRFLLEVGNFDLAYKGLGLEDLDLGLRLKKLPGFRLVFIRDALGWHRHHQNLDDYLKKMFQAGRLLAYFESKHSNDMIKLPFSRFMVSNDQKINLSKKLYHFLLNPFFAWVFKKTADFIYSKILNNLIIRYLFAEALFRGYKYAQR